MQENHVTSQHPFLLKTFSRAETEGNTASLIKGSYKKHTVSIRRNGDRHSALCQDQEQDKDVHSHHFYSVLCYRL